MAGYTCNCTLGYEGENCTNPNCSHGNCENGGNCSVTAGNKWMCTCLRYTTGNWGGGIIGSLLGLLGSVQQISSFCWASTKCPPIPLHSLHQ